VRYKEPFQTPTNRVHVSGFMREVQRGIAEFIHYCPKYRILEFKLKSQEIKLEHGFGFDLCSEKVKRLIVPEFSGRCLC
jgi:hypothetical protein